MRTSLPRVFLLAVFIILSWAARPGLTMAQNATPEDAFTAALDEYNSAKGRSFVFTEMRQEGGLAYALASSDAPDEGYAVLLAEDLGAGGWQALVSGIGAPEAFNALLERFPDSLLDPALRAMFRQVEAPAQAPTAPEAEALLLAGNFTGHRLPWPYKTTAYVTQKDSYAGHMNQIDFDIGGLAVPNGDIYATKPGRVVFVKDSSNTTCHESTTLCMRQFNTIVVEHGPGEYSWYLHIVYRSAVVEVGQQVGFGTKLAVEGNTGYSSGVHLHYMVSKGHTNWTDPDDPNAAPWATEITAVDFDEYTWADLIPRYDKQYTSQNGANLPPVCPAFGGGLLYREAGFGCAGLLENSGYIMQNEAGFQNLYGFNEQASSARVPQGGSMMLYEHGDRIGGKVCLNASDSSFAGDTFDNGRPVDNNVSSFELFIEPNCPVRAAVDLTAPVAGLTSPANGAAVGSSVTLASNASDGQSGVQMVQFTARWGGQERNLATDTSAPYTYTFDLCAAGVPDGSLELNHTVYDQAWNSTTAMPVTVTKSYNCTAVPGGAWSVQVWSNPSLSGGPVMETQQTSPMIFEDWGAGSPGAGIPADGWSARYTRAFNFPGGQYRFHCQSADGCRVLIDNQSLITAWVESDSGAADSNVTLTAGNHTVVVEFFDASGDAHLETWWQGPGFLPLDRACSSEQWCAELWGNMRFSGSPAVKFDSGETLRYTWGGGGPYPMLPADRFGARYTRQARFECGTYQFTLTSDGPARLRIDGAALIDQWTEPATPASYSASLSLTRGQHALVVEAADLSGAASIDLRWTRQSSCAAAAEIQSVSTHIARPNARFAPSLRVQMQAGYLDPARGDGLEFASGETLSAGPGLVRQVVEAGQSYTFDASNGFTMIAPATNGLHSGQWRVRSGSIAASAPANIQVMVDGSAPQLSISAPTGAMRSASVPVRATVTDALSGASHVQFLAWANAGSGYTWHNLGWDTNGSDGWGVDWNTSAFPDQTGVVLLAAAWDRAGNTSETRTAALALDRTPPTASITGPAAELDSTQFLVQWNGSDALSGVHHFDVQVIVDGGTAQNWLLNAAPDNRSAWYIGEMGRSYAFRVRAVDGAGNAGAYTALTAAAAVRVCTPDGAEPDNSAGQARAIPPGSANAQRNHCGTGDVDWYTFQAEAGQHYLIWTQALGETSDPVLTLYAADGVTVLAERDNASATNKAAVLVWQAAEDGALYFRVRQADPRVAGNAVTYTPRVDPVTPYFLPIVSR